uniref:Protein phosphatase, Mg2+/Mn2+ dependent 1J n=1 Tax=Xenopus tropicalis TaxID=8364 RepID=A0A6I8PVP5_XENTR
MEHPNPGNQNSSTPCRPAFLNLSAKELQESGDHFIRKVLTLKRPGELPWETGYAEVINAGKSQQNEDQACCEFVTVEKQNAKFSDCKELQDLKIVQGEKCLSQEDDGLSFYYWGLFDGHAGCGCAIAASRLLHLHICDHLRDLVHILPHSAAAPLSLDPGNRIDHMAGIKSLENAQAPEVAVRFHLEKQVFPESLVIGAIENAFKEMDEQIKRERTTYKIEGGCCALVAVYLLGKLYVANAGDSRYAVLVSVNVRHAHTETQTKT